MREAVEVRKRLEAASFPDLGTMMEGYARAAVEVAATQYRQRLDYSSESIDNLDEIVMVVSETPEADLEFEVRLWGSYLGEVLRRRYAGSWDMYPYPGPIPTRDDRAPEPRGEDVAVPAIDVRGSRLFPLMKIFRRLTMGEEEDLRSFFNMVTGRLGNPARVN